MRGWERFIVLWALGYMAVYVPFFFAFFAWATGNHARVEFVYSIVLPFHFLGMGSNLAALIVTIRDLYKRPFPRANDKVTWCLLITWTGGIGWLVYVFKYGLKRRRESEET